MADTALNFRSQRAGQTGAPPGAAAPAQAVLAERDDRRLTKHEHHIHRSGFWRGVLFGAIGGLCFAALYVVAVVHADSIQRQWIYERGREEGARDGAGAAGLTVLPMEPARDPNPDADRGFERARR